ncbi:unnamed protein product [Moneuplotes crassus]|uniref:Uncharacterized protein n=1 Tax=Euplotes crassus TaxID=5936 RepID=A0AAD1XVL8_EUPCR|nr:unnamed protein product [Moneuplotes crassus]
MDINHKLWEKKIKRQQFQKFEQKRVKKRFLKELEKIEQDQEKPAEVPPKGLSRRKQRRLDKLQQDLELNRLTGEDKEKAEKDLEWLLGLKKQAEDQKAKETEEQKEEAEGAEEEGYKPRDKKTFNHKLDKIRKKQEEENARKQKEAEEKKRKLEKKLKEKQRKSRILSRKTKKGQPVMKNLLNYYINEKLAKKLSKE